MALTPEDVVNKRFQPTKFREGYDQDEVDDFLDEVVVELRRLNQENEELRQRLSQADSRVSDLQRSAQQAPPPQQQAPQAPQHEIAPAPAPAAAPAPSYGYAGSADPSMDPNNTNNLLQLARRLHEEHVREGVEKRDSLIAEGHATAARIVAEAEAKQRTQMGTLEQERQGLERRIDDLRGFEREYRQKLRGYIEGQLRDLDTAGSLGAAPSSNSGPQPSFPGVSSAPQAQPLPAGYGAPTPPDYAGFGGGN
jgi:DivIVA domain-containing protein